MNIKSNKTEFDEFSSSYRQIHNNNIKISGADSKYFSEYKVAEVLECEHGNCGKSMKILDFGCGDGTSLGFFQQYFGKSKLTGIDVSKKSIGEAKKHFLNVDFLIGDIRKQNIPDNTFDIIFCSTVFHHIDATDHEKILKKLLSILKPGGRLYIFEHNPYNPLTQKIVKDCIFDRCAHLIRANDLKKLLAISGFMKTTINYTIFFPRKGLFKKMLFLEKYLKNIPLGGQYYTRSVKR